jgi:hypothetical protein
MSFLEILLTFFVLLILFYIFFALYKYYSKNSVVDFQIEKLIPNEHQADKYILIDKSKIPVSAQGNEYSISFWMFIKDYNYRYGVNKSILYKGNKDNTESNPYIYLDPTTNDMTIKVQLQTDTVKDSPSPTSAGNRENFRVTLPMEYFGGMTSNISGNVVNENFEDPTTTPVPEEGVVGDLNSRLERIEIQMQRMIGMQRDHASTPAPTDYTSTSDSSSGQSMPIIFDECVINNIPIQKWTHVVISVFNNSIEVYIDGKLIKTKSLRGFPKPNLENMHVCPNGGFNGSIANLNYSNMTLPSNEIYNIYKVGPELNVGFLGTIKNFFSRLGSVFTE